MEKLRKERKKIKGLSFIFLDRLFDTKKNEGSEMHTRKKKVEDDLKFEWFYYDITLKNYTDFRLSLST